MKFATLALTLLGAATVMTSDTSIHAIEVKANDGTTHALKEWAGQVVLVVNTASECGYTPQYKGLQELYERYRARGFTVLAFPSNDFGAQEPGSDADIKKFCELRYKTTFPLFSKIKVKGDGKHPLYAQLTQTAGATGEVKWNFTKFLIDGQGKVVARFESKVEPTAEQLTQKIEALLTK